MPSVICVGSGADKPRTVQLFTDRSIRPGNVGTKSLVLRVEYVQILVELPRNVLDTPIRVTLHLNRHECRHVACCKSDQVKRAPGTRHLYLPIETAHCGGAVISLEQPQLHALFRTHVTASTLRDRVEVGHIGLGKRSPHVESTAVADSSPLRTCQSDQRPSICGGSPALPGVGLVQRFEPTNGRGNTR